MRLRRETGDFSINIESDGPGAPEYEQQLPKGLSAEDFVGVLVTNRVTAVPLGSVDDTPVTTVYRNVISLVTTSTKDDDILLGFSDRPMLEYSPTTGIIKTYNANGGNDPGSLT